MPAISTGSNRPHPTLRPSRPMSFANSSSKSPAGTPPFGSPTASDIGRPTWQCPSYRRNGQTPSSSRQRSGIAVNLARAGSVRGEPQRRTPDEFEQHARAVGALWGRRLLQCRTAFLAGSDALLLPVADVKPYLTTINKSTHGERRRSNILRCDEIHAFLDDFIEGRPDRDSWKQFAACGLNRVSIGIASGDPTVRAPYQEHWSDQDLRGVFALLKSAGIGASVLTLVGAGGPDHAQAHRTKTVALIESLALSAGDFVFLLDENELHDPEHVRSNIPCTDRRGSSNSLISRRHSLRSRPARSRCFHTRWKNSGFDRSQAGSGPIAS